MFVIENDYEARTEFWARYGLSHRCPTHSPLATCGEWLCFQIFLKCYILKNIKILGTK